MLVSYLSFPLHGTEQTQFFDVCTFFAILNLVYMMHRQYKNTYQEADDLHAVYWVVPPCLMLGMTFHAHLNRSAAAWMVASAHASGSDVLWNGCFIFIMVDFVTSPAVEYSSIDNRAI